VMSGEGVSSSGVDGSVQRKRKSPETALEVLEWFSKFRGDQALVAAGFNDSDWDRFLQKLRDNNVTGEALRIFERGDLEYLGVKALGPLLILFHRIEDLKRVRSAEGIV